MTASEIKMTECDAYTWEYIKQVPEGDFHSEMDKSRLNVMAFLRNIPAEKLDHRYSEGKWTIKDMLQHMIDVERVFAYRALRFARNDTTELPGFEVDDYAVAARPNQRMFEDLLEEFETARKSTQLLFRSFDNDCLTRGGVASGSWITVRAAGFKLIGHDLHHCYMIQKHYLD